MKLLLSSLRILAALLLAAGLSAGYLYWEKPANEFGTPVINRGLTDDKVVALTFDDGPHPVTTALLLDSLKRHHVKATFFVVGEKAMEYPELLHRIAADGHQVACHTYSHDNLTTLTKHELENEVTYWENDVDGIIGRRPRFLRPPGGDFNCDTISLLHERGYGLALWSVNPGDWRHETPPGSIVKYIMDRAHPGAVILMHDEGINTIRALPTVIKRLQAAGYKFVTLEQMEQFGDITSPQKPASHQD